jgi:energy-converting hydrogenase A subunit R
MARFVPNGDKIFAVISKYDDALADVLKKTGYRAGDTLKLILPFLKAYDVTDRKMRDFSSRNLTLIENAGQSLNRILDTAPAFIVSTSYEHYIRALCRVLEFPFKNTYCTKLRLDRYKIEAREKAQVRDFGEAIAKMPVFEIPPEAERLEQLPDDAQLTIENLDEIFWERIAEMQIGEIYSDVDPIGGFEKADAVNDVVKRLGISLKDIMYVGDSITDEEAFKLVKGGAGLTVSFNGNQYAVNNSEIALMSEDSLATAIVADVFLKWGRDKAINLVSKWNRETLPKSIADRSLINKFLKTHPQSLPKAKIITAENKRKLAEESSSFRKKVRGIAAGRLG